MNVKLVGGPMDGMEMNEPGANLLVFPWATSHGYMGHSGWTVMYGEHRYRRSDADEKEYVYEGKSSDEELAKQAKELTEFWQAEARASNQ